MLRADVVEDAPLQPVARRGVFLHPVQFLPDRLAINLGDRILPVAFLRPPEPPDFVELRVRDQLDCGIRPGLPHELLRIKELSEDFPPPVERIRPPDDLVLVLAPDLDLAIPAPYLTELALPRRIL